jgi:subtilase family serine protease
MSARILEQAAAQGIDVNFATGDFGDETARVGFVSVDYPASSPFATAVGGTSLALHPDNSIAFQTGWGNNATLIADTAALNNVPLAPPVPFGFQGGGGGGSSLTFAKPDFQGPERLARFRIFPCWPIPSPARNSSLPSTGNCW